MLRSMWRERVKLLNSSPNTQLFEVGPSGTLVGGDIALCKAQEGYAVSVIGLKPGIWHVALSDSTSDAKTVLLRWVAPGSLNPDNLPPSLPNPVFTTVSPPQVVGAYTVDGGIHGLLDRDSLTQLIRVERNNRDYVLEAISDYWLWGKNLSVQVGFVVGSADGPYKITARKHNGLVVELSVIPDTT
ncbi:hypothetical protein EIP91_004723 [Steccherinum ochraceum]|uniref:Uncharacterized protein n=1 Tax=Steccherinum ochraceum TaxID=92696 RepID=A0A4R0REF3_9APHY|nr:hypothetical protein EIP91_004723 [Steccherinum ochraceum]